MNNSGFSRNHIKHFAETPSASERIPDPRRLINMPHAYNDAERMRSNREAEINRICDAFDEGFDIPNTIPYQEMAEFAPLFSDEVRKKMENHKLSIDDELEIARLSQKLMQKLNNIYKPIHVVDEQGNDVISPLPPLFMQISTPKGKGNEAMQIFFNALNRDENTPMGTIQKKKAVENLRVLLTMSQSAPDVVKSVKEFNEMVNNFNEHLRKQEEENAVKEEKRKPDTDAVSDDLLDFD